MNWFALLILALIEGITEFLPVSSTGHLIIVSKLLTLEQTDFLKSFELFIQLGAILAVVYLYLKQLPQIRNSFISLISAFLPSAIVGLLFYKFIKAYLLGNYSLTLSTLFWGGMIMILIEIYFQKRISQSKTELPPPLPAFFIGLYQSLSVIPGVSRAASSIIGARLLNYSPSISVEFSFLLAIPTIAAATGFDLFKSDFNFSSSEWLALLIGAAASFVSALIVIKFFLKFVRHHSLIWFGIYRIIIAGVFYFFVK